MAWLGQKTNAGLWQAILSLMPAHDTFIDLFAGSGEISRRKPLAKFNYLVDIDPAAPALKRTWQNFSVVNSDWLKFFESFRPVDWSRTLIYADPPYVHSTRGKRHRYKHEFTDAQHVELLTVLRCCPALVILSGFPSEMYDHHLFGWNSIDMQVMTRGGVRTEKLWFNYPASQAGQFWAAHAGKDYIDRQRIKRKVERWRRRFAAVSSSERLALLSGLLQAASTTDAPVCDAGATDIPVYDADRHSSIDGIDCDGSANDQLQLPMPLEERQSGMRAKRANTKSTAARFSSGSSSEAPPQRGQARNPSRAAGLSLVRPGHRLQGAPGPHCEGSAETPKRRASVAARLTAGKCIEK